MKIIKYNQVFEHKNSENCIVKEYDFKDADIDFSTGVINGRYPAKGYCVNRKVKEVVYVLNGKGTIFMKNLKIDFQKGDAILIEKNEPYYWVANCEVAMPCSPAWFPQQYENIE